ncbi:hypothetical protein ACFFRR_005146 [Megaselia abdita]
MNDKCGEIFLTDEGIVYRCSMCNSPFINSKEFSLHLKTNHNKQQINNSLSEIDALEYELPKDPIDATLSTDNTNNDIDLREYGVYSCELCLKKLNINENFIDHKKLHTNEKNFKCPVCPLWFFNGDHIKIHFENHINDNKREITTEERKSFDVLYNQILKEIVLKGKGLSAYQKGLESCEFCDLQVSSITFLKKHKKLNHTESQLFVCSLCPRRFKDKYKIIAHLKKHLISHSCSFCDKTFNDKYKLDVHTRRHNNIRPFECTICKRGFPTNTEKNTHERNHTENRAFVCEICGNGFKTLQYLWVHKKTHEDKRTYICLDCGKAFNTASVLKCHRYIHFKVKPFPCDICDKAFNKRWTLKVHQRLHFDKLYYNCDICVRGFKQHGSFKAHMKSHANEKNKK